MQASINNNYNSLIKIYLNLLKKTWAWVKMFCYNALKKKTATCLFNLSNSVCDGRSRPR